jgi:hypothetical protein
MRRHHWLYIVGASALSVCTVLGVSLHSSPRPAVQGAGDTPPSVDAVKPAPPLTLDQSEREFLWQIEHHGNVLSRYGFSALAEALRRADASALTALLSTDFTGWAPRQPQEVRLETTFAQVVRQVDTDEPPLPLERDAFIARLLSYRRLFSRPPQVKLALMSLAPAKREDLGSPWSGTCQLRMWGEVHPGKPAEVLLYLQYSLPRPSREVLSQGGWLRQCRILQSQQAQASHYLMSEVAAQRGIDAKRFHDDWQATDSPPVVNTGGVYLCDYDRDGILDMLITDVTGYVLYHGQPEGRFQDVTLSMGLLGIPPPAGVAEMLAVFADLDGDGWEDLILGDRIYHNEQGRRFLDVTWRTNLYVPPDASGIAVADFDRDGRIDLYVTRHGKSKVDSWIEGRSGNSDGNHLWRNLGGWRFQDVTVESGTSGDRRSTFTAVWFDADNDGWPDLYVLNEFGNGVLLHNEGNGRFREHSLVEGAGDFGSMGATCGDIDNDGRIDLYIANMYSKAGNRIIGNLRPDTYAPDVMARLRSLVAGSQLYLNRGGLRFEPVGQKYQVSAIGWAYGPALVDLDNDGWLDLYATCGYVSKSRNEPDG